MNVASRPVTTGKTRTCPHCKATILESLSICPGCMHHLRFDSEAAKRQVAAAPALRVEGIIRHPPNEQPLEYFVIIAIRNDRGEEVTRQVVNVGALLASEKRTFSLSVEVLPPSMPVPPSKSNASTGSYKTPPMQQPGATIRAPMPPTAPPSGATTTGASDSAPSGGATVKPASPAGTANPANPTPPGGSASPAKPTTTGYPGGLKPPNPGGPKRH